MIGGHMEVRMKRFAMVLLVTLTGGVGSVVAQTPGVATDNESRPWYGELAAAATFGHKSSGSVGLEAGYSLSDAWQLFVEVGRMSNVATTDVDQRGQIIANYISGSVSTVQRAAYFDAGVKYSLVPIGMWHPYGVLGLGGASVKTSTAFAVNGVDVTGQLLDVYGVRLGNDLSSTLTKLFLTVGVGATMPFRSRYLVDIGYRYGRIFPKTSVIDQDKAINTQRLQAGIGVRF
jgi:opacity protein-like surface antigen